MSKRLKYLRLAMNHHDSITKVASWYFLLEWAFLGGRPEDVTYG